jgi:hypothetical protein
MWCWVKDPPSQGSAAVLYSLFLDVFYGMEKGTVSFCFCCVSLNAKYMFDKITNIIFSL